jgi:hypothetical protein
VWWRVMLPHHHTRPLPPLNLARPARPVLQRRTAALQVVVATCRRLPTSTVKKFMQRQSETASANAIKKHRLHPSEEKKEKKGVAPNTEVAGVTG